MAAWGEAVGLAHFVAGRFRHAHHPSHSHQPRGATAGAAHHALLPVGEGGASISETDVVLRRTFQGLACGVPAPPLAPHLRWHICMLAGDPSMGTCSSLKTALEAAFAGVAVLLPEGGSAEAALPALADGAASSRCVLLFLTRGVLAANSPQLAAAAAALASGARFVMVRPVGIDVEGAGVVLGLDASV